MTLTELKRLGDAVFADAQAAIDTAHQIVRDCKRMAAELTYSRDDLEQFTAQSRKVTLFRN